VLSDFLETTEPGLVDEGEGGPLIAPHARRRPVTEQAA
jgi:hypothetical protein